MLELYPDSRPVNLVGEGSPMFSEQQMQTSAPLPNLSWQQPQNNNAQVPSTSTLSNRIQEWLGAREANAEGVISDILSGRFDNAGSGTGWGDYATAIKQSSLGQPTTPWEATSSRMAGTFKQLESIANLEKSQAMAQLYNSGGQGSQTLKLVQALQAENPGLSTADAVALVKSSGTVPLTIGPNNTVTNLPGSVDAAGNMSYSKEKMGDRGKLTVEKEKNLPKATSALQSTLQGNDIVTDNIAKALGQSNAFTTGFTGSITKGVPGTDSYNLARTLDTIKANIGFDKLAQMRASSPTGGALGQVSDFENRLLQSVYANLEQSQSKEQFESNLLALGEQYKRSMANLRQAYQNDYGNTEGFDQMFSQLPAPNSSAAPAPSTGAVKNWVIKNGQLVPQ